MRSPGSDADASAHATAGAHADSSAHADASAHADGGGGGEGEGARGRGLLPDHTRATPPVALTIAGTDSGGGAGIAADLRTFAAHGVFGTLAVTAVTAQDTGKVHGILALEPYLVEMQIDAVLGDFPVVAAKTGMLATLAILDALASRAATGRLPPLVVDPVMVASSGAALLEGDAVAAYLRLLPHALVATPNLAEAEALLGHAVRSRRAMEDAARALVGLGVSYAVVKGGHLDGDDATDVVFDGTSITAFTAPMVHTGNVHGTGCTLSAAICAGVALGREPLEAIALAKSYVSAAITSSCSWALGSGHGPLDHFPAGWSAPS
ncbi:MAG TPA: bifunctional hydroxymethylpyrimidine kinase/phosphomethylpyrimidine kinase [Acidimicrobiales bacterium]|nr:bifunctional hydroxymethylpyrimidine kinase/phosphomethylpyrimidine kinase [Acidimicrobiales bacterium]